MNSMVIGIIVVSKTMAPTWTPSSCLLSFDDHHVCHPYEEPPRKHTKLVHLIANEWITWEIKHHKSTHMSLYNNGATSTRLWQLTIRRLHKCYIQIITWHWGHTIHIFLCKNKLGIEWFLLKLWYRYSRYCPEHHTGLIKSTQIQAIQNASIFTRSIPLIRRRSLRMTLICWLNLLTMFTVSSDGDSSW
jgi:hypothetical protein